MAQRGSRSWLEMVDCVEQPTNLGVGQDARREPARTPCRQGPIRHFAYDSCRHRCCPKCQSLARAQWLERRQAELLPEVEYFHVVFTLPEPIAALAYQNRKTLYDLLFRTSAATLRTIAADPKHLGAEIGFLSVLHTWGQNLLHHPHVHCIVPGGGIAPDGERWIACRPGFFLPVRVLSRLFLDQLRRAFDAGALRFHGQLEPLREPRAFAAWLAPAAHAEWVVYAKPPFGGAAQVLDYLGRYTHRVAISNNRLLRFDGDSVLFQWKDYRHDARHRTMTLMADEFIRRFLLHVLPAGFKRIRNYGWLANCHRAERLAICRRLLGVEPPAAASPTIGEDYRDHYQRLTGRSLRDCPVCGNGHMVRIEGALPEDTPGILPRAPPDPSHVH
ncbi:IS91 family transposase [Paraburkholderia sp. HD33-4]|uniref:IS91 family transposase n=1 Tax=Paraburkholderia sp. HD33-4 TaxID=2883242 RepID=UPI001F2199CC|nr:IS91 family transposase [Paraburkholderia sp. HD33-4]